MRISFLQKNLAMNKALLASALLFSSPAFSIIGGQDVPANSELAKKSVMIISLSSKTTPEGGAIYFNCSGSLIAKNIVITAAHCFPEADLKTTVLFGNDPITDLEQNGSQNVKVKNVFKHPLFINHKSWDHDIALLELTEGAPKGSDFFPLDFSNPFQTRSFLTTGYSANSESEQFFEQHKLRSLSVNQRTIAPNSLMWSFYYDGPIVGADSHFILTEENSGGETVEGDSGGALLRKINGKYFLVGINAYQLKELDAQNKIVENIEFYTKVSVHKTWLLQTIEQINGDGKK